MATTLSDLEYKVLICLLLTSVYVELFTSYILLDLVNQCHLIHLNFKMPFKLFSKKKDRKKPKPKVRL